MSTHSHRRRPDRRRGAPARSAEEREEQLDGILALQRSAGNRAVSGLLTRSRLDRWDIGDAVDVLGGPGAWLLKEATKSALGEIFDKIVRSNRASSTPITVPPGHMAALGGYAAANPADGARLMPGFLRFPTFHTGGWILDVQGGAEAMTLDRDVFVGGSLSVETYVHEMVHVTQYAEAGRVGFLTNYFGDSAAEIARRLVKREPLDPFTASSYEREAYALEERFTVWLKANPTATAPAATPPAPAPTPAGGAP